MPSDEILTLRQAAARCGRSRKDLQALIERGALPALRRDGHWLVTVADLALLFPAPPEAVPVPDKDVSPAAPDTAPQPPTVPATTPVPAPAGPPVDGGAPLPLGPEVALLLNLLRQRDEQLAALQEERARLSGQIGFLQGLLVEREARMHLLETAAAPRDTAIELRAGGAATAPDSTIPAAVPAAAPEAQPPAGPDEPRIDRLPDTPTSHAATNGSAPHAASASVPAGTLGRHERLGGLLRRALQRASGSLKRR